MIARIWKGKVPVEMADSYYSYLKRTGLRDYKKTKGNLGVNVLRRDNGDHTQYVLITYWDSYNSIKEFAGQEFDKARYYPEDEDYLLSFEPYVDHFEVLDKYGD